MLKGVESDAEQRAVAAPFWAQVDVRHWESAETEESMGTKEKFWVHDPDGHKWLFKYARVRDDVVRGEDWAEWVVHHLGLK